MLSFSVSAIDLILAICVVILIILYLKESKKYPEELSYNSITKNIKKQGYSSNHTFFFPDDQSKFINIDEFDDTQVDYKETVKS